MHGGGRLLGWLLQLNFIHCVCWGQARHEGLRRFLRLFGLNSGWCALILLDVVDEGLLVAMDLLVLGGRAPLVPSALDCMTFCLPASISLNFRICSSCSSIFFVSFSISSTFTSLTLQTQTLVNSTTDHLWTITF